VSTFSLLKQTKQSSLHTADVHNLLNSIKSEDHANDNSEPRSFLIRTADSSDSTTTLILLSTRSSHLQQSQEHSFFQTQYCEGLIIPSLAPSHSVAQNVISSIQFFACDRVSHTESRMTLSTTLISQPQFFPSFIFSSDHISTMTLDTNDQYSMMMMNTESELLYVSVDMQAASKVADEKRKRNVTTSHRFQQRRKEKKREYTKKFSKLEQKIQELEEERDYYRNVAGRSSGQTSVLSQSGQMQLDSLNASISQSSARSQNSDRNDGRNASIYASHRDALMPSKFFSK